MAELLEGRQGEMDTYYLVDFENVNRKGMNGSDTLKKTDHVHLFFTDNSKKIEMDIISNCGASEFTLHKVPMGNQSLDKHLIAYLGYLIGFNQKKKCAYVIVGDDKGYDNIIAFLKEQNGEAQISRQLQIVDGKSGKQTKKTGAEKGSKSTGKIGTRSKKTEKTSQAKEELQSEVRRVVEQYYGDLTTNDVVSIVEKHVGDEHWTRNIHNELLSTYDETDAKQLYDLIKPSLNQSVKKQ